MNQLSERNARNSRQLAFWLTLSLHLALGTALYLQTSEKPVKEENHRLAAERPSGKKVVLP
jgi:hypothetical protein